MQRSPTDRTEAEWTGLMPLIPAAKAGGRPRTTERRAVVNAIFSRLRSGCQGRLLPTDFPPPPDGLPLLLDLAPRRRVGAEARHAPWGSAGGHWPHARTQCRHPRQPDGADDRKRGIRGDDGGKRRGGRTRHIVVDVLGPLVVVMVHATGIQDRDGATQVLTALTTRFPSIQRIWADGGYAGTRVTWVATVLQRPLTRVKRPRHTQGLQVLQWRWIVERTFGWLHRLRRLRKDFNALPGQPSHGSGWP